ncbi:MAG TPA: phosphoglucomutase/phosphomannomutase family protein [Dehalococcoidia bacterium]|nr:phosphoglucomutase/phosphomannomutase family protein [Dehalococcoidia bacterium]
MTKTPIKFGTDGWRAIIAEDYTFENVRDCAEGVARYLKDTGLAERGLVIGFDTRFGSERFAAASAEVVAAHGIKTYIFDSAAATPVACHAILDKQAGGAIVITASHNPGAYNGFKYKPEYAGSSPPEVVDALEAAIETGRAAGEPQRLAFEDGLQQGLIERFDPRPAYDAQVARLVDLDRLRSTGVHVVFDAMHATGAGVLARLLEGGTTRVVELRGERNPIFPGMAAPEPIGRNLVPLMETVVNTGADVGLATDGDADRLGVVDEKGHFVDQHQTYALLCLYLLECRGLRAPLVRSLTSTRMIDKLGEQYGVPVYETAVGFKYLGPKMIETGAMAAGEESGGYAIAEHLPERDGCFTGLLMLDLLARSGKTMSGLVQDLYARVGQHFYDRIDVHIAPDQRQDAIARVAAAKPGALGGRRVLSQDSIDGFRFELDGGWLLVRPSGTEPLLRIYTEMTDPSWVQPVLEAGRALAGV